MTLKDFLVTPILLVVIYALAYLFRNKFSDPVTRKYFIPALTVRIIGAISVGLIYQFYYDGGDTFNFFTHGSRFIWEAWGDSSLKAIKLILASGEHYPDTLQYSSQIWYYRDSSSYFVVRVVAILDLFTFHTYSATACLFGVISFAGLWAMFRSFYRLYPSLHLALAVSVLFIPSVIFWGSGIMKDTLTLTGVAFIVYSFIQIFYFKKSLFRFLPLILVSFYVIYSIKIYILLCLIPTIAIWYFALNLNRIQSTLIKILAAPAAVLLAIVVGFFAVNEVSKGHNRYAIEKLPHTAEITAKWINYVSQLEGGSGYILGDFDYSTGGIVKKLPLAINVSLFRPYLWEVNGFVMFFAAIESFMLLVLTLLLLMKVRLNIFRSIFSNPLVLFSMIFAISFAFAVGFSTYNFGSLARYKIPLLPFYLTGLSIIYLENNSRKLALFEPTE